ncbi:MAG: MarR family winged helix-turn-helix transcriptional regulator [Alphaproteobacteria bacterium]|nr:MarR family winged helix-turn-helix transcriptional regulator [Alphaproteobacteria bacterium]MDE2011530.1 winged helix-turn-helix transcriptional regulator [Alphaproteobacteria bacterium]MDE2073968.1 winged helix-turn-helix transcriptional regulator [Alphaproteobacteria bacterium]MDE2351244.1 winged helix-turn-helix transcriptional regulator [Alphaproteobacteria bacterium]
MLEAKQAVGGRASGGELDQLVGYQIHFTDLFALQGARAALAERQTTPATVTALLYIRDCAGCDQATVGRLLSINRSSVMKLVDRLELRGFVERCAGRDRRSNGLYLTDKGRRFLLEVLELLKKTDAVLCQNLNARERAELLRLLKKIGMGAAAGAGMTAE